MRLLTYLVPLKRSAIVFIDFFGSGAANVTAPFFYASTFQNYCSRALYAYKTKYTWENYAITSPGIYCSRSNEHGSIVRYPNAS